MTFKKSFFQNNNIKYEDMEDGGTYAITLNPNDDHQYWITERNSRVTGKVTRKNMFNTYHKTILDKTFRHVANLYLSLEYSPVGRLHYHGIITIYDKETLYSITLDKLKETYHYEIDTIKDMTVWTTYCNKQGMKGKVEIIGVYEPEDLSSGECQDVSCTPPNGATKQPVNNNDGLFFFE